MMDEGRGGQDNHMTRGIVVIGRADVMVLRVFQARAGGCVERTSTKDQYQYQQRHQHHGAGLV